MRLQTGDKALLETTMVNYSGLSLSLLGALEECMEGGCPGLSVDLSDRLSIHPPQLSVPRGSPLCLALILHRDSQKSKLELSHLALDSFSEEVKRNVWRGVPRPVR